MNIRKIYPRILSTTLLCLLFLSLSDFSMGQTPPPPNVTEAAMNAGLNHLKNSQWQQADASFDTVLMFAPEYAPAHIGKLCVDLAVTEDVLREEYTLAIDNHALFKDALKHADPAYKKLLQGYADAINARIGKMRESVAQDAHKPGERMTLTVNGMEYAFRRCPAGSFLMGSPKNERDRNDNETPHQVTLSKGFWLLETEVTQGMWASVMASNPSTYKGMNRPVEQVSWDDGQEYIKKLNSLGVAPKGYKFSLPTEAQWEYACRAGTTTAYHFGNELSAKQANFSGRETTNIGSYPANTWGLRDMHGNVYEWCADWKADYPSGSVTDPVGPSTGIARVLRGGSWFIFAGFCRSARRGGYGPSGRGSLVGLRLSLVSE